MSSFRTSWEQHAVKPQTEESAPEPREGNGLRVRLGDELVEALVSPGAVLQLL